MSKILIYQVLPRLFGNNRGNLVFNGSIEQNGCGKLNDITLKDLQKWKELGVTHVWYTGLLEHATCTDYSAFGISKDHSAMVKGKAGSPYAIKDYYDIDPDLASKPRLRIKEFQTLLQRTHKAGLGFLMDFVPNHVARQYHSDQKPAGTDDLGENDYSRQAFSAQNNFYYIPNEQLRPQFDYKGNEREPYIEYPAKATGNDCFTSRPARNDWYETVKLNYGVDYVGGGTKYFNPIPNTWLKMLQILQFWANKGVDGFRCDMAEMVPCEFWQWAVTQIKKDYPNILFIGEVYQPAQYRDYLFRGGFDYLYDKVGLYDTLRAVTRGERSASCLSDCWKNVGDIQEHMLNFLENHDEQRLASDFFAGNGKHGFAALLVSACMNANPFMLYFGQEFGEHGMEEEGFSGRDGRTTIFDYWSLKTIRTWRNEGKYSLTKLPAESRTVYTFYKKVLSAVQKERTLYKGLFYDVMYANYENPKFDGNKLYAFIRKIDSEFILIVANFSATKQKAEVIIPKHAFDFLQIPEAVYSTQDLISEHTSKIEWKADKAIPVNVPAFSGIILKAKFKKNE